MIDPNTGQFNEGFIRLVIFSNFYFKNFIYAEISRFVSSTCHT